MTKLLALLQGRKSYIVSAVGVLYAIVIVGWQGGDWQSAGVMVLGSLGLSSLRAGIASK